ncbi:MAG: hypothetical protein Q9219_007470 [cf. Caloplaca sp. 3 TL-2023]
MPRILSYTPSWLSRPSAGFDLFTPSLPNTLPSTQTGYSVPLNGDRQEKEYQGPLKTIAHRATEVFTVVDNQIRWSDLSVLKYEWENSNGRRTKHPDESNGRKRPYRVLKVPVDQKIRQLSVSPQGDFLAVATSHTVHVVILPSASNFEDGTGPIKVKAFTLGPVTHVLGGSPIASILWHPCGVNGSCLVTITAEAVVRLWELNRSNRWSFDAPTFAIDLKKLESASSQQDNVSPPRLSDNRGFSANMIDLEIASACFGGTDSPDESPWSAMTLWTVTTEGEVLALCPLLPSKWQPKAGQVRTLSAIADAQKAYSTSCQPDFGEDLSIQDDQLEWLNDINTQEPLFVPRENDVAVQDAIYSRPSRPGLLPRLQGPFQISANPSDSYLDVSDIRVVASRKDIEELMYDSSFDLDDGLQEETEGLSADLICLLTTDGRLHLFLNLEGVEGQWLPAKPPQSISPGPGAPQLLPLETLETIKLGESTENEWPTFSSDPFSRYSFFITHSQGIYFFSLAPWIKQLDQELVNSSTSGSRARLRTIRDSTGTFRERIIQFDHSYDTEASVSANACIVLLDSDLGYFLLSSTNEDHQPYAASLDPPKTAGAVKTESLPDDSNQLLDSYPHDSSSEAFTEFVTRPAYEPSPVFWNQSSLQSFVAKAIPSHRRRSLLKEEVRLSGATLELTFSTHRLLSDETATIQKAVADLMNRCQRMMQELAGQIHQVRILANKVDQLQQGGGDQTVQGNNANERLASRLRSTRQRHDRIKDRMRDLKGKIARMEEKPLNEKEREWMRELELLDRATAMDHHHHHHHSQSSADDEVNGYHQKGGGSPEQPSLWWRRYDEVKYLSEELVETANHRVAEGDVEKRDHHRGQGGQEEENEYGVSSEMRRRKVELVMGLLERESALVEAVAKRLERLNFVGRGFDDGVRG